MRRSRWVDWWKEGEKKIGQDPSRMWALRSKPLRGGPLGGRDSQIGVLCYITPALLLDKPWMKICLKLIPWISDNRYCWIQLPELLGHTTGKGHNLTDVLTRTYGIPLLYLICLVNMQVIITHWASGSPVSLCRFTGQDSGGKSDFYEESAWTMCLHPSYVS